MIQQTLGYHTDKPEEKISLGKGKLIFVLSRVIIWFLLTWKFTFESKNHKYLINYNSDESKIKFITEMVFYLHDN